MKGMHSSMERHVLLNTFKSFYDIGKYFDVYWQGASLSDWKFKKRTPNVNCPHAVLLLRKLTPYVPMHSRPRKRKLRHCESSWRPLVAENRLALYSFCSTIRSFHCGYGSRAPNIGPNRIELNVESAVDKLTDFSVSSQFNLNSISVSSVQLPIQFKHQLIISWPMG